MCTSNILFYLYSIHYHLLLLAFMLMALCYQKVLADNWCTSQSSTHLFFSPRLQSRNCLFFNFEYKESKWQVMPLTKALGFFFFNLMSSSGCKSTVLWNMILLCSCYIALFSPMPGFTFILHHCNSNSLKYNISCTLQGRCSLSFIRQWRHMKQK